ncbi:MAG: rhomboid family intramembrane serine protease [Prevotellaceae bacterium]|jgi:membrane associated rhomboid family serine protease|nr:rhomboid family intramembrane serine protease [Prevotellaceae bacterium]
MNNLTPVVRNLIIANVALFVLAMLGERMGFDLTQQLALYYPSSEHFWPYQYITYMFMHGSWAHIFFNMYALWIFGVALEQVWGGKRFLLYYAITGVGAAICQTVVNGIELSRLQEAAALALDNLTPDTFELFLMEHFSGHINIDKLQVFLDAWERAPRNSEMLLNAQETVNGLVASASNVPTVGASGAVYGVLLAFGMLFPNAQLMLLIPPMPVKAKWLVVGYGVLELALGVFSTADGVAHFAHLGGMLFGFILIRYWQRKSEPFY